MFIFLPLTLMVWSALALPTLGRARLYSVAPRRTPQPASNISCTRDYSCLDCYTVQVCKPTPDDKDLREIARFQCGPSNPYCDSKTGTCSERLDPTCPNPPNTSEPNFNCMRDGYFPDPYNCSLYFRCRNQVAYQYQCLSPTQFYTPVAEVCVSYNDECAKKVASACRNVDNAGTKLKVFAYNLFLYCGLNNSIITVDKCFGAYMFNQDTQSCEANCPYGGLFPRDDDCSNYYKCSPVGHGETQYFVLTNMTCPEGQAFSETEYACVDRSLVTNCQVPYPDLFNK